jgi:carbon monoxide dehydrogenase subunit G
MEISKQFTVRLPLSTVWAFFKDTPRVAACLPGAEYLGQAGEHQHRGKVSSKVGPFQANFEGEATVVYDDDARTIHVDGKGVDKKGASRSKITMKCALCAENSATRVDMIADIQLAGPIAQFGRTSLIKEIADALIAEFVRNMEAQLSGAPPVDAGSISSSKTSSPSIVRLVLRAVRAWLWPSMKSRH